MTRVLNGKDRELRTAFLHNLSGSSTLINHYVKQCKLCHTPNPNLEHYIFECDPIASESSEFLEEVQQYINRVNPPHHGYCCIFPVLVLPLVSVGADDGPAVSA